MGQLVQNATLETNPRLLLKEMCVCVLPQNGAEVIQLLHEDEVCVPHSDEKPFTGLKVTSTDGYFEAARHWGCEVTPRHNASYSYSLCEYQTRPLIHSPAVYDRPRDGGNAPNPMSGDLASPPIALGDNTYSSLRLEQGLFLKPAF